MKKSNNKQQPLLKQERPATTTSPDMANPSRVAIPLDKVQKRAYAIFEARGGAPGHELDDWLFAEAEIRTEIALRSRNRDQLIQG